MSDHESTTGASPSDGPQYCAYTEYERGEVPEADLPATGESATGVERRVWDALYEVEDPEMPVSVVDLGLLYGVTVEAGETRIRMTLTYTGCPARDMLVEDVRSAASSVEGITSVSVDLVWSPPWNLEMVTDEGRRDLREFGVSI